MQEQNNYASTGVDLRDDSSPKRNKHLRTIICSVAFIFCIPIMFWISFKIDTTNVDSLPSYGYAIGLISGISGFLGPWIGVWVSSYSILYHRPKRILLYLIYGFIHAFLWLILHFLSINIVALWKFREAFPIRPYFITSLTLYCEFYVYATTLLLLLHLSIYLYDKYSGQ